jgi:hypothetical protein
MSDNRPYNITVNVNGQDLVFRKWEDNLPTLEKKDYVFF